MSDLLTLDTVSKSFGGVTAVSQMTLTIQEHEFVGLIGPNGAGKTTLLNCMTGVFKIDAGSIALRDHRLDKMRPYRISALGVSRTLQLAEHFKSFKVVDYVLLGRQHELSRSVWMCGLGLPSVVRRERREMAEAYELLDRFGLGAFADSQIGELSYGSQRLVDLVRAVAAKPMLLLLDEPTSGCSHQERGEVEEQIKQLQDLDITCVIVDHDVSFLSQRMGHRPKSSPIQRSSPRIWDGR
jgi:branched-chain amino acid transport system ATP-binding protein